MLSPKFALSGIAILFVIAFGINVFGPKPNTDEYLASITTSSTSSSENEAGATFRSSKIPSSPAISTGEEEELIAFLKSSWAPSENNPPKELPDEKGALSEEEGDMQGALFSDDEEGNGLEEENTHTTEFPGEQEIEKKEGKPSITPLVLGNTELVAKETPSPKEEKSKCHDGLYSAIGVYETSKGEESIGVKVRLENGVIRELVIIPLAGDEANGEEQERFGKTIPSLLIGERIEFLPEFHGVNEKTDLKKGFQKAIDTILQDALKKSDEEPSFENEE